MGTDAAAETAREAVPCLPVGTDLAAQPEVLRVAALRELTDKTMDELVEAALEDGYE